MVVQVGTDLGCDIVLNDPTVSGHHAEFRQNAWGDWVLRDVGAGNGTWVNYQRLQIPRLLKNGDRIRLGLSTQFIFGSGGVLRPVHIRAAMLALTPIKFEQMTGQLFEKLGFVEVAVTKPTNDGGVDVQAVHNQLIFRGRYLIQCKRWRPSCKVGAPDVTAFHGRLTMEPRARGIFVTTSSFTTQAKAIGQLTGINLIHGKELGELVQRHELLSIKL